ncbi:glycosyltransferase family 2 protein [Ruminiclostridium cellobioparum]|uniref:Glycosyl transferase family 2 n=1 Tax=Ruminiclostridium cellobioparum subsp. termitidis CT1112 TaxID=1195236 RepID=S0FIV6_RUMCE|nr:glycosyltransferase family 2 protein [Ruminiclostridium cellobioparum]EMS71970.1 Glycosyl transferase family 2 [Ruminiclostridium cellobioparum subsp. termitidis CT1112]
MKQSQVSYIIPYRKSTEDRDRNLSLALKWISINFPHYEVIIVELDTETKINKSLLTPDIKHVFHTYQGIFNRALARNIGALNASNDIFVFADNDVIMEPEKFNMGVEMCCKEYDAIHPFLNCIDITEEDMALIENSEAAQSMFYSIYALEKDTGSLREAMPFAGACLIIKRKPFWKIGGWPEEFIGWGGEDNIMSYKIDRFLSKKWFPNSIYHLPHKRSEFDWYNHPEYQKNYAKMQDIVELTDDKLVEYCKNSRTKLMSFPLTAVRKEEKEEILSCSLPIKKERQRSSDFTFLT